MSAPMNLVVVCVDRDDDLGRKANVVGPVIGRKENLKAATKLALKDPLDSDVNCLFAAIRKYDELKEKHNVEIVTLTGKAAKFGFEADKRVNEQLDAFLEKYPVEGFVLVTDGAEDDQIIPVLQSRAKIYSKETVIVKQAKEVESTFYTIKEALKDPFLARLVFGIPGIILLLLFAVPSIGLQLIMLIAGAYLLSKGFGIEEMALKTLNEIISSISLQKTSFPFYLATLFILAFGLLSGYNAYLQSITEPLTQQVVNAVNPMLFFLIVAIIVFYLGRSIDAIHLKKAFYLKHYFRSVVSAILIWFILDSGRLVFIGKTDLNLFLMTILGAFVVFYIAFRASNVLDIRNKVTQLLIGLPVYSSRGMMLGKVETINHGKQFIEFKDNKSKKRKKLKKGEFSFRDGRLFMVSS